MNDKSKRPVSEEIFDVFRPDGDHDVSAENYRPKKQMQSQAVQGPVRKNEFTDANASLTTRKTEAHTVSLSDSDEARASDDHASCRAATPDNTAPQTTIRLETFSLGMEERLAAMQLAQQKAKDQLSDLENKHQSTDNQSTS